MRRLIALASRSTVGPIVIGVLTMALALTIMGNDCICAETGDCFCLGGTQRLHTVTEEQLNALAEPGQTRYRVFLRAWEEEYTARLLEWGRLYGEYHDQTHTAEQAVSFDQQLAAAHRDFLRLFAYRHALFLEREGFAPLR